MPQPSRIGLGLAFTLLLGLPTRVHADPITWTFTIHITYAGVPEYAALADSDVFASWVIDDPDQPGRETLRDYPFGRVHTFDYGLGVLTLVLPAIDDVWTYEGGRYHVAAQDDTLCGSQCSEWYTGGIFPEVFETRSGRPREPALIPPPVGAVASLWGGSYGGIAGTVTEVQPVPEPSSLVLLGSVALLRRWRLQD